MDASEHPPFPATLRPTEKTRVAVLASLTMATLVFSVGFGNIFIPFLPYLLSLVACHADVVTLSPVAY